MRNPSPKNKLSKLALIVIAVSLLAFSGCVNRKAPTRAYATPVKKAEPVQAQRPVASLPAEQEPAEVALADAEPKLSEKQEAVAEKEEVKKNTIATSAALSKKVQLPQITASQSQYRPIIEIGKESVSGQASADKGKVDKLGNCLPNSIFTDPEIFNGLNEMQSLALREAIADACKKSNADFLVAPRWELSVESKDSETSVTCTVFGYPAKIVDFVDVTLPAPQIAELEKLLAAKDELLRSELAKKDAIILQLQEQIKAMSAQPSRVEAMADYLELMKKYNLDDMNDVRRILALMKEGPALSEVAPAVTTTEDPGTLKVKAGDITLSGNVGVSVPIEVPEVKIKVVD